MARVFQINKGVNRSIEFRGIKGQYILYLCIGLVLLLLLFAVLYMTGCNTYFSLSVTLPAGAGLFMGIGRLSKRYGDHGLKKKLAKSRLQRCVKSYHWKTFFLSGK